VIEPEQVELLECVAGRFRALGEVARLRLLLVLRGGPRGVSELVERVGMGQAVVSKHLGVLKGAGLVECTREGNRVIYRIADERVFDMCALVCEGVARRARAQAEMVGGVSG
jgi:DNA-binding transcriptional ArsR family regulator